MTTDRISNPTPAEADEQSAYPTTKVVIARTPALDEIVEEIHRRANKEDGAYCDFTVTIEHGQYLALCEEESANADQLSMAGAAKGGITKEWCMKMAALESDFGGNIEAGVGNSAASLTLASAEPEWRSVLEELVDLVEAYMDGDGEFDRFTLQPARTLLLNAALPESVRATKAKRATPVAILHRDLMKGVLRAEFTDEVTELKSGTYPLYTHPPVESERAETDGELDQNDLVDIVRTFVCIADRMKELTAEQRKHYPSPLSEGSPVLLAARRACVKRGFTVGGLSSSGTIPLPAPVACMGQHPDDIAADKFCASVKLKMAASRAKGREGWDDPKRCTTDQLAEMLVEHVHRGDPLDVGCLSMMLHQRGAVSGELVIALEAFCAERRRELSSERARARGDDLPTDISTQLREHDDPRLYHEADVLMSKAADEIERYYGGMMAWKQTAEKKDRDWRDEVAKAVDARCAARAMSESIQQEQVLRELLRGFMGAAYPVDTTIDARGYKWSEAYLDQARIAADCQLTTDSDPLDWPIPCDLVDGAVTLRKGVKLRTVLARMKFLSGVCRGNLEFGKPTASPRPAPATPYPTKTIDTTEFRKLTFAYAEAIMHGTVPQSSEAWGELVAYIDQWAEARTVPSIADKLAPVIQWLDGGCDAKKAAHELRLIMQLCEARAGSSGQEDAKDAALKAAWPYIKNIESVAELFDAIASCSTDSTAGTTAAAEGASDHG